MKQLKSTRAARFALAGAAAAIGSLALASSAMADGAFVIGDQNAAVGTHVTFWGAQWWKDNGLSGGAAPAAFKGYADTAVPVCGQSWTTRPGNSSEPPATVDGVIPVVVSSSITKSGPVISGDAPKVVLVSVDPGYGPDPGHPGTGTVISQQCPSNPWGGGGNLFD